MKQFLKNVAWIFWPTRKQLKERGLDCRMYQEEGCQPKYGNLKGNSAIKARKYYVELIIDDWE